MLVVAVAGSIDRGVVRWNILNKVSGSHEKLKRVGEKQELGWNMSLYTFVYGSCPRTFLFWVGN